MGLLEGKKLLITGVLMDSSIAFHVARIAQEEGAHVVLTSFGRTMKITQTISRRLPQPVEVVELDVTNTEHLDTLAERLRPLVGELDGVLHSIGFAPQGAFDFMSATWEAVSTALHASAYSLKALAAACEPLMSPGGAIVGLTFSLFIRDNIKQFGALKAIGVTNGKLRAMVGAQAGAVGFIGYGIGVLLAAAFIYFSSAGADQFKGFYTPWQIPAATAGVVTVMILLTGFLSLRTVLKTDPAEVFR